MLWCLFLDIQAYTRLYLPHKKASSYQKKNQKIHASSVRFRDSGTPNIRLTARGFAWVGAKHRLHRNLEYEDDQIVLHLRIEKTGYFSELTHEIQVQLPNDLKNRIEVELEDSSIRKGSLTWLSNKYSAAGVGQAVLLRFSFLASCGQRPWPVPMNCPRQSYPSMDMIFSLNWRLRPTQGHVVCQIVLPSRKTMACYFCFRMPEIGRSGWKIHTFPYPSRSSMMPGKSLRFIEWKPTRQVQPTILSNLSDMPSKLTRAGSHCTASRAVIG